MLELKRDQILAYRHAVQGLDRSASGIDDLAVLALGVQDSPAGAANQSLHARLSDVPALDDRFSLAWTLRGAPHLHRRDDLQPLATQLRPISDADVMARMPGMAQRLEGEHPLRVFDKAVRSMWTHSAEPTDKGTLSAAVTRDLPEASSWCGACGATHVFYSLFLHSALPAGIRLVHEGSRVRLLPMRPWQSPDQEPDVATLIHRCLHVLGPATMPDLAAFLGTTAAAIRPVWPQDLAEVEVEGKRCWAPEADCAVLEAPPTPSGVRLLPPGDAYLQSRDRALTVPDPAHRKALWRPIGSPGALVVDGEVTGLWRAKKSGASQNNALRVTVTGFAKLDRATRADVDAEAQRLAAARAAKSAMVDFEQT